jgi:hypothetical protein
VIIILVAAGVVLVAVVAGIAVQVRRYGSLQAAFSGDLKAERKRLAGARSLARSLSKEREAELKGAKKALEGATAAREKRIAELTATLAYLENPGTGPRLGSLHDVTLYRHAVQVKTQMLPLLGASARVENTGDSAVLTVTSGSGLSAVTSFDTQLRSVGDPTTSRSGDVVTISQRQERKYSLEQVIALRTDISNAAVLEKNFREDLPRARAAAADALETAVGDTGDVDLAAAALQQVESGSAVLDQLEAARRELEDVERDWTARTAQKPVEVAVS